MLHVTLLFMHRSDRTESVIFVYLMFRAPVLTHYLISPIAILLSLVGCSMVVAFPANLLYYNAIECAVGLQTLRHTKNKIHYCS